jgi:hypothetical protein
VGLFIDTTTGEISGTPTSANSYQVTITATDSDGQQISNPFTINVG